ncbi:MAG: cobalamin biosynthesis protein P47K [Deltaproteobacteria bacterium]|nr:MAG: cobalamin biosynthesis protein P47K [Deltaproteobacteria bacterium]
MKLLIMAGFLGSGKTTLLLQIAKRLSAASLKIAIIENEIGEIGVDGDYLNREELHVQKLFGGCICCTLSTGLIETLEKIELHYQPDLVILEATGVARPGDILTNVNKYQPKVESIKILTLVDAFRFEMLMEVIEPLLTAQIKAAHTVVVNKIDQVQNKTLESVIQSVECLNPEAKVSTVSAEVGTNLNSFLDDLS